MSRILSVFSVFSVVDRVHVDTRQDKLRPSVNSLKRIASGASSLCGGKRIHVPPGGGGDFKTATNVAPMADVFAVDGGRARGRNFAGNSGPVHPGGCSFH